MLPKKVRDANKAHLDEVLSDMLSEQKSPFLPPRFTIPISMREWIGALRSDIRSGKAGSPIRLAEIGRELGAQALFWPLILDAFAAEDVRSDDGPSECAACLYARPSGPSQE